MDIKLLTPTATIPTKGSLAAAGYDLYADETVVIPAGETRLVHTGIALAIPAHFWGGIYARSGLAAKRGLRPANCVGVIDADYRGEIMVAMHNDSHEVQLISHGDRIAQFVLAPVCEDPRGFEVVDELDSTDRGEGGFGSTGTN